MQDKQKWIAEMQQAFFYRKEMKKLAWLAGFVLVACVIGLSI